METGTATEDDALASFGEGPPEVVAALGRYLSEGLLLVRDGQVVANLVRPGGLLGHGSRVGTHTLDHTHPDDLPAALAVAAEVLAGGPGSTASHVVRLRRADGTWEPFIADVINCEDDPVLGGLVARTRTLHDAEASLRALDPDEVLRSLVDAMPTGVIVLERYGHVLHANGRATEMLGLPPTRLTSRRFDTLVPAAGERLDDLRAALADLGEQPGERDLCVTVAAGPAEGSAGEDRSRSIRLRLTSRGSAGAVAMVLVTLDDVTEQEARERDLVRLAAHDPLTGLLNRGATHDLLAALLADGTDPLALYCDVDGFKAVNDRHGHVRGDDVLVEMARQVADAVSPWGTVGRVGGDELLAVGPGPIGDGELHALMSRVAGVVVPAAGGRGEEVTLSVGWARARPGDDAASLVARADAAMYARKRSRRSA